MFIVLGRLILAAKAVPASSAALQLEIAASSADALKDITLSVRLITSVDKILNDNIKCLSECPYYAFYHIYTMLGYF